jgi:hypothetical protein
MRLALIIRSDVWSGRVCSVQYTGLRLDLLRLGHLHGPSRRAVPDTTDLRLIPSSRQKGYLEFASFEELTRYRDPCSAAKKEGPVSSQVDPGAS